METLLAFMQGEVNRGREMKVFDWDAAAKYIKDNNIKNAWAGLSEDWEWTSGQILKGGKPVKDSGMYLASTWAMPVLVFDDGITEIPMYKMKHETEYDEDTIWPQRALDILEGAFSEAWEQEI